MKKFKKIMAVALSMVMVLGLIPVTAVNPVYAANTEMIVENIIGYSGFQGDHSTATAAYGITYKDDDGSAGSVTVSWELDDENITVTSATGTKGVDVTLSPDGRNVSATVDKLTHGGNFAVTLRYALAEDVYGEGYSAIVANGVHATFTDSDGVESKKNFGSNVILNRTEWADVLVDTCTLTYTAPDATTGTTPNTETYEIRQYQSLDGKKKLGLRYQTAMLAGNPGGLGKAGYSFAGWGINTEATPAIVDQITMDQDYTVKACWSEVDVIKSTAQHNTVEKIQIGDNAWAVVTTSIDTGLSTCVLEGDGNTWNYDTKENMSPLVGYKITEITEKDDCDIKRIGDYLFTGSVPEAGRRKVTNIGQNLKSINLPSCTSLGDGVFYDSQPLTDIKLPACTSIGNTSFYGCQSLTKISLPVCKTVGASAFDFCMALTDVSLPVCETVGDSAFDACMFLMDISLPAVKNVGGHVFDSCMMLTNVSLPVCERIGDLAFKDCVSIDTLTISGAAKSDYSLYAYGIFGSTTTVKNYKIVGDATAKTLFNLSAISNKNNVNIIFDEGDFVWEGNNLLNPDGALVFSRDNSIISNCASVPDAAFKNAIAIKDINLKSCTVIGDSAFEGCASLTEATLPECTTLGTNLIFNRSFSGCGSLEDIYLPKCTEINGYSFERCASLAHVYLGNAVNKDIFISSYGFPSTITNNDLVLYYANQVKATVLLTYAPFNGGGGTIDYLTDPSQYLDMYKANLTARGKTLPESNTVSLVGAIQEAVSFVGGLFVQDVMAEEIDADGKKDVDGGVYQEDDIFPYSINIRPQSYLNGGAIRIVEVKDVLPDGVSFVPDSFEVTGAGSAANNNNKVVAGPTFEDGVVKMTLANMTTDSAVKLAFKVKADGLPDGVNFRQVINTATIIYDNNSKTSNRVINYIGAKPPVSTPKYNVDYLVLGLDAAIAEEITANLASKGIYAGSSVNVAEVPIVPGYTCTGWETMDATVTNGKFVMPGKDVMFLAIYDKIEKHQVSYTVSGDIPEDFTVPMPQNYFKGETVVLPEVVAPEGYEFSGWTATGGTIKDGAIIVGDSDIVISGVWVHKKYNITYVLDGLPEDVTAANTPTADSAFYDDIVVLKEIPVIDGYEAGLVWVSNDENTPADYGAVIMPAKDIEVHVAYTKTEGGGENPGTVDSGEINVSKIVIQPDKDSDIPEDFTFTLVKDNVENTVADMTADTMPEPTNASFTISKGAWTTAEANNNGDKTITNGFNPAITFTAPGIYTYILTETAGSADGMTYSKESYQIKYNVAYDETDATNTTVKILNTSISKIIDADGTIIDPPAKVEGPSFTNRYNTPPAKTAVLKVEKKVVGNSGDRNYGFTFEIALNDTGVHSAQVYNADGTKAGDEIASVDGKISTSLKHGQYIIVHDLADGVGYTVAEANDKVAAEYKTSTLVTTGGTADDESELALGEAAKIATGTVDTDGENSVLYTNSKSIGVDTGARENAGAFAAILVIMMLGAAITTFLRKKVQA